MPDDGPFKQIGTNCKFCKKPINLDIALSYDEIADQHKLIPIAACNRCADIRVERRVLEFNVKYICTLRALKKKESEEARNNAEKALGELLKRYASMIARFHFMDGMSWDDQCLDVIMEHPANWSEVLARLWKMFRDSNP